MRKYKKTKGGKNTNKKGKKYSGQSGEERKGDYQVGEEPNESPLCVSAWTWDWIKLTFGDRKPGREGHCRVRWHWGKGEPREG